MILGLIIDAAVGSVCVVLGLLIWKKEKVSLIHDYHYKNVKKEGIPAYARLIGVGLIIVGTGICATGIFNLLESPLWWIPLLAGFAAGIYVLHRAQMKYNGSWFSR